jgi:uncharacterized membrane protein YphA (DoxX/SURF4 family)
MDGIGEVQLGISTPRPSGSLSCLLSQTGLASGAFMDSPMCRGAIMPDSWTTAKLNWFLPAAMIPALAIIATAAEILFGLLLVLGWKTRITALLSGVLLTTFALTMTMALGVKAPLNFSVFSSAGGALLLGVCANFPFSLDELLQRNRK